MSTANSPDFDKRFSTNAMASFLQIAAVALLMYVCFQIIRPFLPVLVWGIIISVSLYPTHQALARCLGGRSKLAAALITILGLALIVLPAWMLADSSVGALKYVAAESASGALRIPAPDASVKDWWLVGDSLYAMWAQAASNLEATLNRYDDQVKYVGEQALSLAGNTIATVFQFVFALILAGAFFLFAGGGYRTTQSIANKLVGGDQGKALTDMSIGTVRSVFKGVLGVAAIQALASAIGLAIAGIPGAGLWAGAVLVVAIVQLPPLLILGPIAAWHFSVADTVPAVIFIVFALIVSVSDSFLKPLFLGRGLKTPMLVILLGAIGGALSMGIVGLFIGAVVLAVGFELLSVWMGNTELDESPASVAN